MKKQLNIFGILTFAFVLFSCGPADEKKEEKKADEAKPQEEIQADTLVQEEVEEVIAKETIEDYAELKSYDDAVAYFGDTSMVADTSWYAEGTVMMLSHRCTDPNNGNRVTLVWEKGGKTKLSHVEISHQVWGNDYDKVVATQKVKTKCGLYTGMSLNELAEFCGTPITFSGFGWDYAGGIRMDGIEKLEACNVNIRLDMDLSNYKNAEHLLGDIEFKSDAENVKNQPIFIQTITYYVR